LITGSQKFLGQFHFAGILIQDKNPVALGIVSLQTVCELLLKFEMTDKRKHENSAFQAQWPATQSGCEVSS